MADVRGDGGARVFLRDTCSSTSRRPPRGWNDFAQIVSWLPGAAQGIDRVGRGQCSARRFEVAT
jgi:hypothetical protein